MKRVFLISPFAANVEKGYSVEGNIDYLRRCMLDCLKRGEAPFAPHGLYPQCLDDSDQFQRALGIAAGQSFMSACALAACYIDRGVSKGMRGDLEAWTTISESGVGVLRNERIRAPEVLVIDFDGNKIGLVSAAAAIKMAQQRGLDLITINPKSDPPVCKILDWSKYKRQPKPIEYRSLEGPETAEAWLRDNT